MDDRRTEALYLELVNVDRERYVDERGSGILARPGALRLTCWENLVPSRTDLPRRLAEFGWLAVYEADASFTPPGPVADTTGLHFLRTSRPGQGLLSARETVGLLLVLISPKDPGDAATLRAWGDFVHLHHIAAAAVPGYTMITPYERATSERSGGPRFLHLYEMDTDDAETAFQSMTPMVAERLGGFDTDAFSKWANHDSLLIDYVNTFRRIDPPVDRPS
jgi:hypothetical protein